MLILNTADRLLNTPGCYDPVGVAIVLRKKYAFTPTITELIWKHLNPEDGVCWNAGWNACRRHIQIKATDSDDTVKRALEGFFLKYLGR